MLVLAAFRFSRPAPAGSRPLRYRNPRPCHARIVWIEFDPDAVPSELPRGDERGP
jgi:hypothetical protein